MLFCGCCTIKEKHMALYVWKCEKCEKELVVSRKISERNEPPKEHCIQCGSETTWARVIAPTNFSLVGKGWYKDGYSK